MEIGEGSSYRVMKCQRIRDDKLFACRIISNEHLEQVETEVALMQMHCDPNNVSCVEAFDWEGFLFIVIDLMDCGPVTLLIVQTKCGYHEKVCQYILQRILTGIAFLHERNIIHRDIKSKNVLFNSDGQVKLADFSTAT